MRRILWFSCGVSSAVAAYLAPDAELIRIRIDDEHVDNDRFADEVSRALGREVTTLQSPYRSVDAVIRSQRYVNGPGGAACTKLLKRRVRQQWESENPWRHEYIWGFDANERDRLDRMRSREVDHTHSAPLIDAWLSKQEAHGVFMRVFEGIKRPAMYELGFPNNNCIGCVKGGKGYWNRIRSEFPEVFASRAAAERFVGRSCIKGVFLDELDPNSGRDNIIYPQCGIACITVMQEGKPSPETPSKHLQHRSPSN